MGSCDGRVGKQWRTKEEAMGCERGQGLMSVEKRVPFGFPPRDVRERRCEPHREARGHDKARGRGVQGQARAHGWFQREPGSRGAQMLREKMWMPWNELNTFGKRMEPLSGKTPKPRMWDLKLEAQYRGLGDVEKTVLKEKSGPSRERKNVKLRHSVASALQASAGLRKGSPEELWGKREVSRKRGAI